MLTQKIRDIKADPQKKNGCSRQEVKALKACTQMKFNGKPFVVTSSTQTMRSKELK